LLANIYLHYVLDLWADWWRRHVARGDVIIVRFADDFVLGFEDYQDACRFLHDLRERFAKFGLELHSGKTRLIEFGRFAAAASRHIGIDRQRARPYDGHGRLTASDPSPRSAQNEARRDPSHSPKTRKSWPAQRQPGGDIVKEHGPTRGRDAQEIKPSTPARVVHPFPEVRFRARTQGRSPVR
jgi:hypothetical protein